MPYPKRLLNDYETIALDLHPHWWSFAKPVMALIGAISAGIAILVLVDESTARTALTWVALVLIAGCTFWVIVRYTKWATTHFVITSDRIVFRNGVLAKNGIEIPLERVNNVLFSQSIFERMLGAGNLLIESGGERGQERFSDVRRPDQVQKLIHSQIGASAHNRREAESGVREVGSELERLEGLVDRGTITEDEFEKQKRKLLGS